MRLTLAPPPPSSPALRSQALRGQLSREELAQTLVPRHLGNLERLLGQHGGLWFTGHFSLADVRVADLCLHLFAPSLPGCLEDFPRLASLVTRVKARPRIAAYLASHRCARCRARCRACTDACPYHTLPSSQGRQTGRPIFGAHTHGTPTRYPLHSLRLRFLAPLLRCSLGVTHGSPYSQVRQHRQVLSARLVLADPRYVS